MNQQHPLSYTVMLVTNCFLFLQKGFILSPCLGQLCDDIKFQPIKLAPRYQPVDISESLDLLEGWCQNTCTGVTGRNVSHVNCTLVIVFLWLYFRLIFNLGLKVSSVTLLSLRKTLPCPEEKHFQDIYILYHGWGISLGGNCKPSVESLGSG